MNIEEADISRLGFRIREGNDPLRFNARWTNHASELKRYATDVLDGRETVPRGVALASLDRIAATLLARLGISPVGAAALAEAAAGIGIANETDVVVAEVLGPASSEDTSFWVQDGPIRWGGGFLEVPELPASVVSALCDGGQTALASIVSHPTLDPLGLTIRWALEGSNDGTTALVVNHDPAALDRRTMNAIWKARRT